MKKRILARHVLGIGCAILAAAAAAVIVRHVDERMQEQERAMLYEQVRNAAIGSYAC